MPQIAVSAHGHFFPALSSPDRLQSAHLMTWLPLKCLQWFPEVLITAVTPQLALRANSYPFTSTMWMFFQVPLWIA